MKFLLFTIALQAFAADPVRFKIVKAAAPTEDSCKVASDDISLLEALKKVGWKRVANNFPAIDFAAHVALVVTTSEQNAQPAIVEYDREKAWITFSENNNFFGTGVLVMQVRSGLVACARKAQAASSHSGGSISINSADPDKPASKVEDQPTLRSKTPPLNEH